MTPSKFVRLKILRWISASFFNYLKVVFCLWIQKHKLCLDSFYKYFYFCYGQNYSYKTNSCQTKGHNYGWTMKFLSLSDMRTIILLYLKSTIRLYSTLEAQTKSVIKLYTLDVHSSHCPTPNQYYILNYRTVHVQWIK